MPNQPLPYGNIFAVNTPHLDRLTDRLYAQQQQLDNRRYQQMQSLDDEFKRSVANIRTADIPEFTKAYEDYKNAKINLLRGHKMGNIDYMKAQQDANEKLARAYSLLNESASEKAWEKDLGTKIHSNWKQYNDDATDLLKARMSIPVNQLPTAITKDKTGKDVSLYGDDAFRYKGNFSFSKDIKDAFGTSPKDLNTLDETKDPNALERTLMKYKGYNNPYQAYRILGEAMADPRKADEFIRTHTFNPIQERQIEDHFNSIMSNPTTQKVYGLTGNEDFVGDDTELGHAIKMAVMASTTEPTKEPVFKPNLENKRRAGMEDWLAKNGITYQQALNKIRLNASLQGKGGTTVTVGDLVTPEGETDLTKLLQGISVNNIVTGKAFKADKTLYNPVTKEITYHDVVDNKDYTVPASKYRQIINTINTAQDLKVYDNLIEGIDKAYAPPKSSGQKSRPPLNTFIKHK